MVAAQENGRRRVLSNGTKAPISQAIVIGRADKKSAAVSGPIKLTPMTSGLGGFLAGVG